MLEIPYSLLLSPSPILYELPLIAAYRILSIVGYLICVIMIFCFMYESDMFYVLCFISGIREIY